MCKVFFYLFLSLSLSLLQSPSPSPPSPSLPSEYVKYSSTSFNLPLLRPALAYARSL